MKLFSIIALIFYMPCVAMQLIPLQEESGLIGDPKRMTMHAKNTFLVVKNQVGHKSTLFGSVPDYASTIYTRNRKDKTWQPLPQQVPWKKPANWDIETYFIKWYQSKFQPSQPPPQSFLFHALSDDTLIAADTCYSCPIFGKTGYHLYRGGLGYWKYCVSLQEKPQQISGKNPSNLWVATGTDYDRTCSHINLIDGIILKTKNYYSVDTGYDDSFWALQNHRNQKQDLIVKKHPSDQSTVIASFDKDQNFLEFLYVHNIDHIYALDKNGYAYCFNPDLKLFNPLHEKKQFKSIASNKKGYTLLLGKDKRAYYSAHHQQTPKQLTISHGKKEKDPSDKTKDVVFPDLERFQLTQQTHEQCSLTEVTEDVYSPVEDLKVISTQFTETLNNFNELCASAIEMNPKNIAKEPVKYVDKLPTASLSVQCNALPQLEETQGNNGLPAADRMTEIAQNNKAPKFHCLKTNEPHYLKKELEKEYQKRNADKKQNEQKIKKKKKIKPASKLTENNAQKPQSTTISWWQFFIRIIYSICINRQYNNRPTSIKHNLSFDIKEFPETINRSIAIQSDTQKIILQHKQIPPHPQKKSAHIAAHLLIPPLLLQILKIK